MTHSSISTLHECLETLLGRTIQDFMHAMKRHDLSAPQIHALLFISHTGECQVSDIGAMADASNAAASQMVERLVQRGLVDRREDPRDRRNRILSLSERGRALIRDSVPLHLTLMQAMSSLSTEDRETVHHAFALLVSALRGADARAGDIGEGAIDDHAQIPH